MDFPFKFGRRPHDPAKLAAAPQRKFSAVLPPPSCERNTWDFDVLLCENDLIGDCTYAALANAAKGIAALNGYTLNVDQSTVVAGFATQHGISPSDQAALEAAEGLEMADVLNFMQQHGFNVGNQLLAGTWGTLGLDRSSLALALAHLGIGYWGITLYDSDVAAFQSGSVWDTIATRGNVVSGHAVTAWDYSGLGDTDIVRICTWGTMQVATWRWVADRLDEAHGVTFPSLGPASGKWFAGYDPGTINV